MLALGKLAIATIGALALTITSPAAAQAYPDRPIKVVVPWPAAGIVDIAGRVIADKLQTELGQPVVIDNKAGAGGMIGADSVARAAPDGYTLLLTSSGLNMNVALGRQLSVDLSKAYEPIRVVAWAPAFLVAYPGLKVDSVKDLVALAKTKPGELAYASAGTGSPAHFAAEMFRSEVGIDVIHVPYKGAPPAMNDQIAGRVAYHFANAAVALPQIKAGTVTALAITAAKRSALVPSVPTMAEAGYPGFKASQWLGFFAPAGTPKEIVDRLAVSISKVLDNPEVRADLERQAMEVDGNSTPEEFAGMMKTDLKRWQEVVTKANIKVN